MRFLFAVVLTAVVCLTALPQDGHAKFVCGNFDGTYTCKHVSGTLQQHKAPFVPPRQNSGEPAPAPLTSEPPSTDGWGTSTSRAPSAAGKTCPPNTELLGGNCVPYTARCKTALALDVLPQPCAGLEEKQVCKPRGDGLKDCCCITYSKF